MADVGGGTESLSATHAATYELLQRLRAAKERESVASTASSSSSGSVNAQLKFAKLAKTTKPKTRRLLRGHSSRVTDLKWGEGDTLVSCARDGLMHLWHGPSARVAHTWQTPGSWAMTCCLDGCVAAVGGLDNMVSVYLVPDEPDSGALDHVAPNSVRAGGDATAIVGHRRRGTIGFDGVASSSDRQFTASAQMPEPDVRRPDITLEGHGGYISCVRFLDSGDAVTASGDASCAIWDAAQAVLKTRFWDHAGDVIDLAVSREDPHVFASASLDGTAKLWDARVSSLGNGGAGHTLGGGSLSGAAVTFEGHQGEVNACHFLPGGTALATGSDDATVRVFDVRCARGGALRVLQHTQAVRGVTSLTASASGRLLFAGYEDSLVRAWDLYDLPPAKSRRSGSRDRRGNCCGIGAARAASNSSGSSRNRKVGPEEEEASSVEGVKGGRGSTSGSNGLAWTLEGHLGRISCVEVSRNGTALATGSWDSDLRIWA